MPSKKQELDAEEMRLMMTIFCLMAFLTGCPASDKPKEPDGRPSLMIGVDLMPVVLLSGAGLHFSHALGRHWSIYAGAWLGVREICGGQSETEKEHYNEFPGTYVSVSAEDMHKCECAFQYWIGECHNGTFLSAGIRYGDRSGIDTFAEAGFRIRITKGLGLSLSLKCGICEGIRKGGINTDNINIGINYAF
ncbi:MAG: hypothetical protein ACI3ZL_01120 [Candidatus Cryptobacteroides sp.]